MPTAYFMRGIPGVGKSSYAAKLRVPVLEADDFHIKDGEYEYDPRNVAKAHANCFTQFCDYLYHGRSVCVANTFIHNWELAGYISAISLAKEEYDVRIYEWDIQTKSDVRTCWDRQTHNVPLDTVLRMWWEFEEFPERSFVTKLPLTYISS